MAFTFFKVKQEEATHCPHLKIPAKTYCAVKLKKSQENAYSLLNESPSYCNYLVLPLLFKILSFLIALETDKHTLFNSEQLQASCLKLV